MSNSVPKPDTETLSGMIAELWRKCMTAARNAGEVKPEVVQDLISASREVMAKHGVTKRGADMVLCLIHSEIHWDWTQPTDRIFETMLDFELTDFFRERGLHESITFS